MKTLAPVWRRGISVAAWLAAAAQSGIGYVEKPAMLAA
jgi:hypothetical protein